MEQQFKQKWFNRMEVKSVWVDLILMYQNIFNDLGININSDSIILDFGCGSGEMVYQFRKSGYKAFGVDIKNYYVDLEKSSDLPKGIFHTLELETYRIPFEDNTFDFIFSNQVFEHVQNISEALGEIKRVLKPGGVSLHMFPSKYRTIEPHINVPFAGVFQEYPYLLFWAFLGIKNEYQKGLNYKKIAEINYEYLKTGTNYPSLSEINKYFADSFQDVYFLEDIFIKHSYGRLRHIYGLTKIFPFLPFIVRIFHERIILVKKS